MECLNEDCADWFSQVQVKRETNGRISSEPYNSFIHLQFSFFFTICDSNVEINNMHVLFIITIVATYYYQRENSKQILILFCNII